MSGQYDTATKVADGAMAGAITIFGLSLSMANELLHFVALIITIITGTAAAWFHLEKAHVLRKERRNK